MRARPRTAPEVWHCGGRSGVTRGGKCGEEAEVGHRRGVCGHVGLPAAARPGAAGGAGPGKGPAGTPAGAGRPQDGGSCEAEEERARARQEQGHGQGQSREVGDRGVSQEGGRESLESKPTVHVEETICCKQSHHRTSKTVASLGSASAEEHRFLLRTEAGSPKISLQRRQQRRSPRALSLPRKISVNLRENTLGDRKQRDRDFHSSSLSAAECSAHRTGRFLSVFEMGHRRCASVCKCFNVTLAGKLHICAELVTGQLEPWRFSWL